MSKTKYIAAFYLRLSKEDGDKEESYSISNQRELAKNYIKSHDDISFAQEFVDDGYTGSNFNRPRFRAMIDMVIKGKINCVIVKDLSRFGREYAEMGNYFEKIFPLIGVRFIKEIVSLAENEAN